MPLKCQKCGRHLTGALWKDQGEFFIPCLACGVRNLVVPMLSVVGWRRDASPLPRRRTRQKTINARARQMARRSRQVTSLPAARLERRILLIRGHKVMLDSDLAELYGVPTRRLNEQVKRNRERFPADFMFQLSKAEDEDLRSQIATSSSGGGRRRSRPYAFTQEGVAMLSSVLRSAQAIQVNIAIMRAFVRLRELLATHKDLARKLEQLERKYDARFRVVFTAIRKLMAPDLPPEERQIGFQAKRM